MPDVRSYLVRHPINRIISQYLHGVVGGREQRSLTRAVLETPEYIDASRYGVQLDRYVRCFDPAQLLVVRSESLRDDRAATVRGVLDFIGVDPDVPLDLDREVYRTSDRLAAAGLDARASEPVPPPLDRYLRSVLRDDVVTSLSKGQGVLGETSARLDTWVSAASDSNVGSDRFVELARPIKQGSDSGHQPMDGTCVTVFVRRHVLRAGAGSHPARHVWRLPVRLSIGAGRSLPPE